MPSASTADSAVTAQNATKLGGNAIRWLLVNPAGTIVSQTGGFTVTKAAGNGNYIVNAGSPVSGHAIIASTGEAGSTNSPGATNVGPCGTGPDALDCSLFAGAGANDGNHIFVGTTDATGAFHDESFYLMVY